VVEGYLLTTPGSTWRIEFFITPPGATVPVPAGFLSVTAGDDGVGTIRFVFDKLKKGTVVTAVAVNEQTGERTDFSNPVTVNN
jgi:hypothetical protein